jgi:ankyrin repeat protein
MNRVSIFSYFAIVVLAAGLTFAADIDKSSDAFYAAIRANDLARLQAMLKEGADVNLRDNAGTTPLMYAAAVGSLESMKLLLDKGADSKLKNNADQTALMWSVTDAAKVRLLLDRGADVNAASKRGRTALILAALSDRSAAIVRMLMAAGANPKVVDGLQMTPLIAATIGNDTETVRLFVDAGLDVNAADFAGFTPLMNAADHGNTAVARLLIAKGANVNVTSGDGSFQKVKAGTIALGNFTPLLDAAAFGSPELVTMLLDAGANVNVRDVRGMTPLMLAVATDRQNPAVIAVLLAKHADPNVKSLAGETALDWARKIGSKPAVDMLKQAGAIETSAKTVAVPPPVPVELGPAVERGIRLLEKSSVGFAANGGCASCHAQNITDIAAATAKSKGIGIDPKAAADRVQLTKAPYFSPPNLLDRLDGPGAPDVPFYALAALASAAYPPDRITDAIVVNTAAQQRTDGRWSIGTVARPPIEDGDIFRTALGIRALKTFAPAGRGAEMADRVARAKSWLVSARAVTAEDRNMQLLGLRWAGVDDSTRQRLAKAIVAQQRADGGWSQTSSLESDAYATGQSLYALAEGGGMSPGDPSYRKGVAFLLSTQRGDGSWYIRSRAPKFQPYFESGFPYGHDQWISSMGTGWASTALALALGR